MRRMSSSRGLLPSVARWRDYIILLSIWTCGVVLYSAYALPHCTLAVMHCHTRLMHCQNDRIQLTTSAFSIVSEQYAADASKFVLRFARSISSMQFKIDSMDALC